MFTTLSQKMYVVRLEKCIDDPLIEIDIINTDILF